MDAVFYFSFYIDTSDDDDEYNTLTVGFYVSNIRKPWSQLEEDLADVASELEMEYGVHDWGTLSGANAIGYHSSEVKEEHCDELMERWRQAFMERDPGCVVSAVFEVPNMGDMNDDADILQYIKNAQEQQQAQQLRDTLNQHVANRGSVVAPKKM